jgi:hypothetical protein
VGKEVGSKVISRITLIKGAVAVAGKSDELDADMVKQHLTV